MKWTYRAFRQVPHPDYKPYCGMAELRKGNKIYMVNAEGYTPEEALENVKRRVKRVYPSPGSLR
jgi:hypothetical protein